MKTVLLSLLLLQVLWGDFYVLSGTEDIRMEELSSGKIDFTQLSSIPFISSSGKTITVRSVKENFNNHHLNFRTASIDLVQQNYVLTEYTTQENANSYRTTFGNYEIKKGRMLQLFYHNKWYGVIIGDPIEILHERFNDETLDSRRAYAALKQARIAFPDDATLALYEALWYKQFVIAKQEQKMIRFRAATARYQVIEMPNAKKFYGSQIRQEMEVFLKAYPHSGYVKELNTLLMQLKQ